MKGPRWEYRAAGICVSLSAVDIASKYWLNSGSGLARKGLHRDTVLCFSQSPEAAAAWGQRWPGEDTAGALLHCPPEWHRSTSLCDYCPQRQGEMLDLQVVYWKFKVLTTALWFFFFFLIRFPTGETIIWAFVVISTKSQGCRSPLHPEPGQKEGELAEEVRGAQGRLCQGTGALNYSLSAGDC